MLRWNVSSDSELIYCLSLISLAVVFAHSESENDLIERTRSSLFCITTIAIYLEPKELSLDMQAFPYSQ